MGDPRKNWFGLRKDIVYSAANGYFNPPDYDKSCHIMGAILAYEEAKSYPKYDLLIEYYSQEN